MSTYFEEEARLQEAAGYKKLTLNHLINGRPINFVSQKSCIQRRPKGQNSRSSQSPTNQKLDKNQDQALCWYAERLHQIEVSPQYKAIAQAANQILAATCENDSPTVSKHWPKQ